MGLLLGGLILQAVHAQPAPRPFDELRIGASYAPVSGDADFDAFWESAASFALSAATPFYVGELRIGAVRTVHDGRAAGVPGFHSYHVYLGWSPVVRLPGPFEARVHVTAGDFLMRFDDEERASFGSENELAFGAGAGLSAARGPWRVEAGVMRTRVLTAKAIDLASVSAGITYVLPMPSRLRRWLE